MEWMGLSLETWKSLGVHPREDIVRAVFTARITGRQTRMRLACVNRYKLYVNGQFVLAGPCRAPYMTAYYDEIDLSGIALTGSHEIRVVVASYPYASEEGKLPPMKDYGYDLGPMVAAEMDGSGPLSWEVRADLGYAPDYSCHLIAGPSEVCDFRKGYSAPVQAQVLGGAHRNPWGELKFPEILPRPVPNLESRGILYGQPFTVKKDEMKKIRFYLPELTTGYPAFRFEGGSGTCLRICYAESVTHGDIKGVRDDRAGEVEGICDTVFLNGEVQTYSPFDLRAVRVMELEFNGGKEDLQVTPMPFLETRYPMSPMAIQSTEPWVGYVFDISVQTLRNCMHDSYEDCPYYEQMMYDMDARLEGLYTHRLCGDVRLSRQAIRLFAASRQPSGLIQARYPTRVPQVIPGFSLYWIEMLCDDYLQTADLSFIQPFLPTAFGVIQAFLRNTGENGMIRDMGKWEFADWTPQWNPSYGVPTAMENGPSALHNLHFCYTLNRFAELLKAVGRTNEAREMHMLSGRIQTAVHKACWDACGLYREGPETRQFSQHTQVWAVLSGLLEGEMARKALRKAFSDPEVVPCSFVYQFYVFRAYEKAGIYEETLALWDKWRGLEADHLTTIPEEPNHPRSDCHGWGALACYEFPAKILGVDAAQAGWKTLRIRPRPDLVRNLSGTVPTPLGPVFVSWVSKGKKTHLWVRVPKGSRLEKGGIELGDRILPLQDDVFDGDV